MAEYQKHPDSEVRKAIIQLTDALCMWERATGRENILIVKEDGFSFRAQSGKPITFDHITDEDLLRRLGV